MKNRRSRLLSRKTRVRTKFGKGDIRLSVFRSNKYLYAQIIKGGETIIGGDEKKFLGDKVKGKTKTERAKIFGTEFAKKALKKKVKKVIFDRGPYLYHGRVKAFAQGAREGGLEF